MGARVTAPRAVAGAPTGERPRTRRLRRRTGAGRESSVGADAGTVLQLAVLLQAGVTPARAWSHLARAGNAAAAEVVASMETGMPLPDAVASAGAGAWREVGAAYRVATAVGAPLAESLRGLAVALRDAQEAVDDVRIALAEPAGTARLMGWLPVVAVALGAGLGFDTFGTLLTNPLGLACLLGGAVLIVVAQRWTARLVRSAQREPGIPGLDAELVAIALSGGVSIDRARTVVREARALGGSDPAGSGAGPADAGSEESDDVAAVLSLSRSAGVPAAELLRASAAHARHEARVDGRLRAARLSTRLLIPLGVCTLPAFLLLGVAPMVLSVISTMSVSL